jgi:uncharacterized protein YbjT (DUF2867 family)
LAAVLRDDVASAAAAVLISEEHDGRTYELTGPEAFTMTEAAEAISRASGQNITFENETDEQAFASRAGSGAADWEVRGWVSSYWAIRDGSFAVVTDDVSQLTGQAPTSLQHYLATHPG